MSQATYATITTIAQSLGISHVKESIASKITHEVKRNILKILSDAKQLKTTTNSKRLKSTHINAALESNHLEPLFGFSDSSPEKYQLISAGCVDAMDLLTYLDQQIPIDSLQRYENRPYPLDTTFDFEWVAVQGHSIGHEEEVESESYEPGYIEKSDTKQYPHQMIQRQHFESDTTMSSKHFISYELKLYNQTSRQLLLSNDFREREKMLLTIRKEKCLETLVPYYLHFSETEMQQYPKDFDKLYISVSVVRALVQNDDISIDIYMQTVITIAMSLLLGKFMPANLTDHYIIRDYAADLLKVAVDKAVANYPMTEPTLTQQLLKILLDPKKTTSTKYGALSALQNFGLNTISHYVMKVLPTLINDQNLVKAAHSKNAEQATRLYDCAVVTAGLCLHSDSYKKSSNTLDLLCPKTSENYRNVMNTFGSDLLPYYLDEAALLSL